MRKSKEQIIPINTLPAVLLSSIPLGAFVICDTAAEVTSDEFKFLDDEVVLELTDAVLEFEAILELAETELPDVLEDELAVGNDITDPTKTTIIKESTNVITHPPSKDKARSRVVFFIIFSPHKLYVSANASAA